MPEKRGKYTYVTQHEPKIEGFAAVVGKKESEGPLAQFFDERYEDTTFGEKTWEKAEAQMLRQAVLLAIKKAFVEPKDLDCIFAGDLLNQCISSAYGLRSLGIPFVGLYGACSTMAEGLALSALFVDSGCVSRCAAVTSSHFCAAERQFRLPLEYGGQRTPTAQWTATASGAAVIGKELGAPTIKAVTIGRIADLNIKDAANMGAAMAPAAAQTLTDFLTDMHMSPSDFDLVLTGDLGSVGSELLRELLKKDSGIDIDRQHNDCGLMIYNREKDDVHAGGSGCGCSGAVVCSFLFQRMREKKIKNVLFAGTGALMSPTSTQQGESIPGIAHAVWLQA